MTDALILVAAGYVALGARLDEVRGELGEAVERLEGAAWALR